MEGKSKREMEERSRKRGKVKEIQKNTQRKKRAQRTSHTEGSQKAAEGKFKKAQTSEKTLRNYCKRERRKAALSRGVVVVLGELGAWKRGCGEPGEGIYWRKTSREEGIDKEERKRLAWIDREGRYRVCLEKLRQTLFLHLPAFPTEV